MVKRILFFIIAFFSLLSAGCQTTKGVATGLANGITKDTQDFWQAMLKADNWMKENLW